MSRPLPCPCASGEAYARCCEPLHRGVREADTPSALMRSRYAAFARGEIDYLWRTLHREHPERSEPEDRVRKALRESASAHKYPGLIILDARDADAHGVARVLFHARVFEKGRDKSFTECSEFAHDGTGWRYCGGELRAGRAAESIDAFLAH